MADYLDKLLRDEDMFWWEVPEEDVCNAIHAEAERIERDQSNLRSAWQRYARAYSNRNEMGLDWDLSTSNELVNDSFVTENVVKSVIDTAASIIAKNRVKVRVLTNGANFLDQRKAKRLEKFIYAEMKARKTWDLGPLVFRDACIFGTGVIKVFPSKKKVRLERRLICDLLVDERRAIDGHPQEMFERRMLDKEVLKGMFPKLANKIDETHSDGSWCDKEIPSGKVVVLEAWRLGKKGRHVICMEGLTLLDEEKEIVDFPFVFYRWDGLPVSGFYGLGLARDLHGIQTRINQLNLFIQRCQDLIAVPRIFVDMASKVLKVQIDNKIGAIIPYRGKPPTFFTPQALNSEIYQYKDQLKRAAFEFAGISQLSAQSLKPAGLESAVALREFSDIETSRFVIQSQRYERMYTDIGEHVIKVAAELYSSGENPTAKFPNATVLEKIEWKDVNMEADRFELDIQPASLLSMSPSARLQAVTELAQVGQLDKNEVRYLLNHPDLEASNDRATADFRLCQKIEEQLLNGEDVSPEPFYNLQLQLFRIQLMYQEVQVDYDDVPEEILENIRTYISQLKSLNEQSVSAGVPPAAQEGAPPEAAPEAPLTSGVAGSDVVGNLPGQITG